MKDLANSLSLALFLFLLCVLSISIYFGNVTVENMETTSPNRTLSPELVNEIKKIIELLKTYGFTYIDPSKSTDPPKSTDNEFEKLLNYWNKMSSENGSLYDFVPKTRVMPNVCPDCNSQSCTNFGSLGGNQTNYNFKNRFSDFIALHGAGYKGNGNWTGFGKFGEMAEKTGSGVVDVTKNVVDNATALAAGAGLGAIHLAESAGSGTTDLLRDTGSGATDLIRDTGSGATDLIRDAGSTAVDLLKDTGSGVKDLLKSNPMQLNNQQNVPQNTQSSGVNNPYQTGYYTPGTYSLPNNPLGMKGIDPYSYNGALISKGSNYIPVTSDFSSFRK